MSSLEEIKALLEKKANFVRGTRCLAAACAEGDLALTFVLVTRVHSLLKARYSDTSIEAWKAGQHLFSEVQRRVGQLDPDQARKLQGYLEDAKRVLQADVEVEEEQPQLLQEDMHPMDLLLGLGSSSLATASHFDDTGPIVDDSVRWERAQRSGITATAVAAAGTTSVATATDGPTAAADSGSNEEGQEGAAATGAPAQQRQALQRQILEGIQAVYEGISAVTRGTEAVERELEQVLSVMRERAAAGAPRPTPPMSQKVFNSLPVVELDATKLFELGHDARCPICTDTLVEGDKVFMLPCKGKHWYHPACVKPWLSKTNSCPVCREELPTDDPHYEAHKELQAEAAVEQAGAANALSHNEFMYI